MLSALVFCLTLLSVSNAKAGCACDDCLSAPNSAAPVGEHWYYHTDWAKHRNCWYLRTRSARQTDARPTSPASAVATSSIANQIKQAKEVITAKLGNPASITFPDIAPGKAVDSVCGEAEVKGGGETREMPFVVQKSEIYLINGSDDLRASRAMHKMCD
jgi:hypothetical protein